MTWTQPMCGRCWIAQHGDATPTAWSPEGGAWEICAWCGATTNSGIYVRADPATLPHPTER